METDLFIIAAGKGSRMKASVPKALVPISDGMPCLTTTLLQIGNKFENVYIVVNNDPAVLDIWKQWREDTLSKFDKLFDNVKFIAIKSGLGDGHAVFHALENVATVAEEIIIMWGDVFLQHPQIVDELLNETIRGGISGVLPAVMEDDPYVTLVTDPLLMCSHALFSKLGEKTDKGYHDQSMFKFNSTVLLNSLRQIHSVLWKGDKYMTHNGEMSLLHSFHHFYNLGHPARVYETKYPTLSFNTIEEVYTIQQEINKEWLTKNGRH